jgi:2-furoyl-CoA dehydrogenase large subunit
LILPDKSTDFASSRPVTSQARKPQARKPYVGQRVLRVENPPLLRGRGQFIDDLPSRPGALHVAILRSPHPHAEIVAIDASKALACSGVRAVVTGREVAALTDPLIVGFATPLQYYGIAVDRVRYVGEPVAVICAATRYLAEDALEQVRVDYRALPAVVDPLAATAADAPVLHPAAGSNVVSYREFHHGDTQKAFAEAKRRSEITIAYPRNSITPMEGYAVVAEHLQDGGGYDVISNFQGPFSLHPVMARALRIPGSRLRHRSPPNSGGSFGSKLALFPYIVVLCICARIAGRPVKWIEDRLEHLAAASAAPNRVTRVEAAYGDDGVVSALRLTHWDDHGAYLRAPMPAPIYRMHGLSTNAYGIKNVDVSNYILVTNKCPTGAVRGFGGPQLYFAIERMMHTIATELQLDPLDLIRRNLIPAGSFPYRAPAGALIDSGDYQRVIDETVRQGGLEELKHSRARARQDGRTYGIGYAVAVEPSQSNMGYISTLKTGIERQRAGQKDGAVAAATINIDPLGTISVVADCVPQGQGHQTALAQIVADQLGVEVEDVVVNLEMDTQKDGWSIAAGNYSCRFAPATVSAAHIAAVRLREKLARIAASSLNVPPDKVEFASGEVFARGNPENALSLHRVAGQAHWSPASLPDGMAPALRESVAWSAPELTPTTARDEINTSLAYGFGFDFCGVEIDRDTGEIRIDKYVTSHDCGTILNPGLADGQIHGSFAAAIGASLYEEFAYAQDGSFLSGTFADYLIPSAAEMPKLEILHPVQSPSPFTRLGAKGIAEGNQYSTPVCLANAVADALGRTDITVPLKPAKILDWIAAREQPSRSAATRLSAPGSGICGGGSVVVHSDPRSVWAALLNEENLRVAIPGCERLARVGPNAFDALVRLGVGPVSGQFEAKVGLFELEEPRSAVLRGDLSGSLAAASGEGRLALTAQEDGCRIDYHYDIHLSGRVAMIGGRMLDSAARHLINEFFRRFALSLGGRDFKTALLPWRMRLTRFLGARR